jgi:hypothetical protein
LLPLTIFERDKPTDAWRSLGDERHEIDPAGQAMLL